MARLLDAFERIPRIEQAKRGTDPLDHRAACEEFVKRKNQR